MAAHTVAVIVRGAAETDGCAEGEPPATRRIRRDLNPSWEHARRQAACKDHCLDFIHGHATDHWMKVPTYSHAGKVPQVTALFWLLKIAATTLGETGGDAVSMSLGWGYLLGSGLFLAIFLVAVAAQIRATRFHPWLYWLKIIATTTVGTTMADFADRSLGIGYAGGSSLLLALLLAVLLLWWRSEGSISVQDIRRPRVEAFYWATILASNTLGTALGDFLADSSGLGYRR